MASRRLPLLPVLLATVLALVAAAGVIVLFGDDDGARGGEGDGASSGSVDLEPSGELPASAAEVRLGALGDDEDRVLGDYLGQGPVVLNFFAEWCTPCLREMPDMEAVHQAVGDRVTVLGLALPPEEGAGEMVEQTGVTYPTFYDEGNSALTFFGGTAMPTTVFIDGAGEVVRVESRPLDEEALLDLVGQHLGVTA